MELFVEISLCFRVQHSCVYSRVDDNVAGVLRVLMEHDVRVRPICRNISIHKSLTLRFALATNLSRPKTAAEAIHSPHDRQTTSRLLGPYI
jgi:hypothetical protein